MKNSLFLFVLCFLFSSCQEQKSIPKIDEGVHDHTFEASEDDLLMQLPISLEKKSDQEKASFFENMDESGLQKLADSYKVVSYLKAIGKFDGLNTKGIDHYSDLDLSKILDVKELAEYASFVPVEVESRYCLLASCSCHYPGFFCNGCFVVYLCNGYYRGRCCYSDCYC